MMYVNLAVSCLIFLKEAFGNVKKAIDPVKGKRGKQTLHNKEKIKANPVKLNIKSV
jgi:hypothetical protein